jgi:hypothetical protein
MRLVLKIILYLKNSGQAIFPTVLRQRLQKAFQSLHCISRVGSAAGEVISDDPSENAGCTIRPLRPAPWQQFITRVAALSGLQADGVPPAT